MRACPGAAFAIALVAITGCHLYFEQGDDDDDTTIVDAGRPWPDAGRITPDARPGSPDAVPCVSIDQFLTQFGNCMSYTDWQGTGMCDVPNETTAMGPCLDCHADGTGDIFLSSDCQQTFLYTAQQPYILGLITPAADDAGCFSGFASGSLLTYSSPSHPTYAFSDARAQAINDFFSFTYARYADPDFDCTPAP